MIAFRSIAWNKVFGFILVGAVIIAMVTTGFAEPQGSTKPSRKCARKTQPGSGASRLARIWRDGGEQSLLFFRADQSN
jgi:hypothetical protein